MSTFATEDMTLVAVLKTKGIECTEMQRHNGGCRWVFPSNKVIEETVSQYVQDDCAVEPREYTKKLSLVRRDMYNFLGHAPERLRAAN
jgi:Domain of unknown function (DUF5659)